MKKRLHFALMAMCVAVSGFALTVNTKTGSFVVTGDNICTNGTFANADFTGWTPVSATEGSQCADLFAYSADDQSVRSVSNLFSEGMYYKFTVSGADQYVVTFKIRQVEGEWPYSTNIRYTSVTAEDGTITNTYGCQGTNGAGKNYINLFGTNGGVNSGTDFMSTGYAIQLTSDWQDVAFATVTPDGVSRDWYFYLCNLSAKVEIKDIAILPVIEMADVRKAAEPLALAKTILAAYEWEESDALSGLKETIQNVEAITSENSAEEMNDFLDGLQDAMNEFIKANLDDYLATCATGSKWADVTAKGQKIKTIGDWTHYVVNDEGVRDANTDRMMHCNSNDATTRENNKEWLSIPDYGYGSALGNHVLQMTKELKAGSYIFAMKGNAHTMYQSNTPFTGADGYQNNEGFETGHMVLQIEDEAGNVVNKSEINLPAALDYAQTIVTAKIPADGKYNFVVLLSQPTDNSYYGSSRTYGGSYYLKDPQIYCKLEGYNAAQLAYIEAVKSQITAARTNYDQAIAYQEDAAYVWGKAALKECTDSMLGKVQEYEAYSEADIVATFDPDTYVAGATNENAQLEHKVYVEVARDLIAANRTFVAVNDTLTSLQTAIDNAKATLSARVYDAAEGKAAFQEVITGAEQLNQQMKATDYSVENAAAITAKIAELTEAAGTFKSTVPASAITTLADIDFANPATTVDGVISVAGAVNSMILPNYNTDEEDTNGTNSYFYQGYWNSGVKVYSDMLRVGNGEARVNIDTDKQVTGTNILRLTFDYYFARLTQTTASPGGTYCGFYLNDAEDNKIAQLYYSPYWGAVASEENNTFGLNISGTYLPSVGASSAQNDAIAAESNVTHFEVVLDYGEKSMYCSTSNSKGNTQTTEKKSFEGTPMASFSVVSTHANAARRCWFDNLKIECITAGETEPYTGIQTVKAAKAADNAVYNLAGQKVGKSFKGIVIVNGKKTIQK